MRLRAKVDANQGIIVAALRGVGCSVYSAAAVGHGFPDLVVFAPARGEHVLIEVKVPGEKLTPMEAAWHRAWKGPIYIVSSVAEALGIVNVEVLP